MKNFKLIIFVFSILLALPYSSFAQKQLVKTVYKGVKGLFKREAKVLTKEGIEATNKSILKDAFKSGAEEIGKDYVRKASAKQLIRSAVRKNLLKEIEEKELGSLLRYGMVSAKKEIAHTEKSVVKKMAEKASVNNNYSKEIRACSKKIGKEISKTFTRIIISSKNQYITSPQYLKIIKNKKIIIKETGIKDAKVLRENMLKVMGNDGKYAKNTHKNGNQAHHVVGNETPIAGKKLEQYGIDINDPMNGIFLPSSDGSGLRGVIHRGSHKQEYYEYIEQMFSQCKSKKDCYEVLDKVKSDLYKGKIKLYKEGINKVNKTFSTVS